MGWFNFILGRGQCIYTVVETPNGYGILYRKPGGLPRVIHDGIKCKEHADEVKKMYVGKGS